MGEDSRTSRITPVEERKQNQIKLRSLLTGSQHNSSPQQNNARASHVERVSLDTSFDYLQLNLSIVFPRLQAFSSKTVAAWGHRHRDTAALTRGRHGSYEPPSSNRSGLHGRLNLITNLISRSSAAAHRIRLPLPSIPLTVTLTRLGRREYLESFV
jgi:hypothetical protein